VFGKVAFNVYEMRCRHNLIEKFKEVKGREGSHVNSTGHGLRLSVAPDLLIDDAVFNVKTTNIKRLLRLHWEDTIQLKEGSPLVLYLNPKADYVPKQVLAAGESED